LVFVISTTRLRLLALPLAALGFASMMDRTFPDIMISEDARLVAIRGESGTLAVNRPRPSSFSMDDWKRALLAEDVLRPSKVEGLLTGLNLEQPGFFCDADACLARHGEALIVHVEKAGTASRYCTSASLIVVDDATVEHPCGPLASLTVLTARDLARRGSASFYMASDTSAPRVVQAISEP